MMISNLLNIVGLARHEKKNYSDEKTLTFSEKVCSEQTATSAARKRLYVSKRADRPAQHVIDESVRKSKMRKVEKVSLADIFECIKKK